MREVEKSEGNYMSRERSGTETETEQKAKKKSFFIHEVFMLLLLLLLLLLRSWKALSALLREW